jgi:hypothetical protein
MLRWLVVAVLVTAATACLTFKYDSGKIKDVTSGFVVKMLQDELRREGLMGSKEGAPDYQVGNCDDKTVAAIQKLAGGPSTEPVWMRLESILKYPISPPATFSTGHGDVGVRTVSQPDDDFTPGADSWKNPDDMLKLDIAGKDVSHDATSVVSNDPHFGESTRRKPLLQSRVATVSSLVSHLPLDVVVSGIVW